MDLSAIIFVVLALAWAVYLTPKALKHHDEMASDRLVEGHSDKVRILSRTRTTEVVEEIVATSVAEPAPTTAPEPMMTLRPPVTRAVARRAAQRRRRVLGLLVLALAVVWGLTWFAYLPIWAPAVPGALVAVWLVLARLSVRKLKARSAQWVSAVVVTADAASVVESATAQQVMPAVEVPLVSQDLVDLLAEDTIGVPREEIEAALAQDGSLWDPLPMTLPTYVNKARARRTVRTIELTGINSSGHDRADSTLARESAESAEAAKEPETGQRRVAGA